MGILFIVGEKLCDINFFEGVLLGGVLCGDMVLCLMGGLWIEEGDVIVIFLLVVDVLVVE